MHNKKWLKPEKKSTQREVFIVFVNEYYWLLQFIKANENYYPKAFLEKYNFNKGIKMYSNNSWEVHCDEEHDEKCIDLLLEAIRTIWGIYLKKNKKWKKGNFFKLRL